MDSSFCLDIVICTYNCRTPIQEGLQKQEDHLEAPRCIAAAETWKNSATKLTWKNIKLSSDLYTCNTCKPTVICRQKLNLLHVILSNVNFKIYYKCCSFSKEITQNILWLLFNVIIGSWSENRKKFLSLMRYRKNNIRR